jgi:hypothetical protein
VDDNISHTEKRNDTCERVDTRSFPMCLARAGVHVTLPDYYSPDAVGMIVPKTKDGRVVFMLPWEGVTIAGTTDALTPVTPVPRAKEEDVKFILEAIEEYLDVEVLLLVLGAKFVAKSSVPMTGLHRTGHMASYERTPASLPTKIALMSCSRCQRNITGEETTKQAEALAQARNMCQRCFLLQYFWITGE